MGNVSSAYLRTLDDLVTRGLARAGAMCARDRDSWPRLLARRPGLRLVDTADEVLNSDAAIVVILTPPASHAELARRAIAQGKHVLVEKPLALSQLEGRSLIEAAGAAGVTIVSAPFVTLSPTFRQLAAIVQRGEIGRVHSARAMYGNLGSDWAAWYHDGAVGPLAEVGIYNLQSLTALLGSVAAVQAATGAGIGGREYPDTVQVLMHHVGGALSAVLASHAVAHYRRPAVELYGSDGTAYLQGDDWDPTGIDVWRAGAARWESYEAIDRTWHWTDGLREAVMAVRERRPPQTDSDQDVHLLEIVDAASAAAASGCLVEVESRFEPRPATESPSQTRSQLHDHTRSPDEQ